MDIKDTQYQMRRRPYQARGQTRVNSILQAATDLFIEVGYEQTTTNKIVQQAKIGTGSFYQFFPNKESVMNTLAQRYLEGLLALYSEHFSPEHLQSLSLEAMVAEMVDLFIDYDHTQQGLGINFYGVTGSSFLRAVSSHVQQEVVRAMETILGKRLPKLRAKERTLVAVMIFALVRTVMSVTIPDDGFDKDDLIAQTKLMLTTYLVKVADGAK